MIRLLRSFRLHPVAASPRHLAARPLRTGIIAAAAGLSLLGVLVAGKLTREALRDQERYSLAFAEIDCPPPPGQKRCEFLAEVQYLAGMPDRLSILDDSLAARLGAAFAQHPWVEKVEKVAILPSRRIHVQLCFRTPPAAAPNQRSITPDNPP